MSDRATLEAETAYVRDLPGFKKSDPHYFKDPMIDKLLEVILMMGGELWTLRHRQAITEELLSKGSAVSADLIETFIASDDFKAKLDTEREELIKRMFSALSEGAFPDPQESGFKWVTEREEEAS